MKNGEKNHQLHAMELEKLILSSVRKAIAKDETSLFVNDYYKWENSGHAYVLNENNDLLKMCHMLIRDAEKHGYQVQSKIVVRFIECCKLSMHWIGKDVDHNRIGPRKMLKELLEIDKLA